MIHSSALLLFASGAPRAFALVSLAAIVSGCVLCVRGIRWLARNDPRIPTRTSRIRDASPGLVEVSGFATGTLTMLAPVSGHPCYLYRTAAWEQIDAAGKQDWKKVAEETMHLPFFLDDHSGRVRVNPDGVDLDLHRDFQEDYSESAFALPATATGAIPEQVTEFLRRHGVNPACRLRVEECCIRPKDFLYAVGTLSERREGDRQVVTPSDPVESELVTANTLRQSRATPSEPVPQIIRLSEPTVSVSPEMTQQSKIAAALLKAGMPSPVTGAAEVPQPAILAPAFPRVTEVVVNQSRTSIVAASTENSALDGRTHPLSADEEIAPTVLSKGPENAFFLISWRSQSELSRALAWKALALAWGGSVLALLGFGLLVSLSHPPR